MSDLTQLQSVVAPANENNKKLLVVQRVLTPYRYELLCQLADYYSQVQLVTAKGERVGTYKLAKFNTANRRANITIDKLSSIKIEYSGESRTFPLFFYPQVVFKVRKADILLLEGTTNLLNNIFIVPIGKLLGKRIVWWDAGYSLNQRTRKRKLIDFMTSLLIRITDAQVAYSTKARNYMTQYMRAKNCHRVLNTLATTYFDSISEEIARSVEEHQINHSNIKLLYVGAVEERKKVKELIDIVHRLNSPNHRYSLTVVGDGAYRSQCEAHMKRQSIEYVTFAGAIYDKENLKKYYFDADLFVLPGDGGLGIAQSLLFGLPVVCVAADGTELDYIDDHRYVLDDLNHLQEFLIKFTSFYKRHDALRFSEKLQDKNFIFGLFNVLEGTRSVSVLD